MLAEGKLNALTERKAALRQRIRKRRGSLASAAAPLMAPLAWLDLGYAGWRRVAPWVGRVLPMAGLLLGRSSRIRSSTGRWLRLVPIAVQATQLLMSGLGRTRLGRPRIEPESTVH